MQAFLCTNYSLTVLIESLISKFGFMQPERYYYPGKDIVGLQDERQYLDLGYTVCKMKIGASDLSHDCDRIEAALKIVGEGNLCVDANGRFGLETTSFLRSGPHNTDCSVRGAWAIARFEIQAALSAAYDLPTATGENLFSHQMPVTCSATAACV